LKFLTKTKDGGPESPVDAYFLFEIKSLCSVALLKFNRGCREAHHTQKPVALMEYLINTYSNEGETVLDFTMGSGTTGVAAANTGRHFIGIELDEKYYNIAKERIEGANPLNQFME
jgi:DNA modification methylase